MSTVAKQLMQEEGSRSHVYKDSEGFFTIGIGRLVDARIRCKGITIEEQLMLLANDIDEVEQKLDIELPWWRSLSEPRRAVIIGMAFQLGVTGLLGFRQTLKAIKAGDYALAAQNMLISKWAQQTAGRAKRMAKQLETGAWQPKDGYTLP